jgi:hypothetical protein
MQRESRERAALREYGVGGGLSKQSLSSILFWSIVSLSALLLVFLALVIGGVVPVDSPDDPAATEPEAVVPPPAPSTATGPPSTAATRRTETSAPAAQTVVVVTASRGASWFSARVGSEQGRVLDERVLEQGDSATVRGRRIWLSVGASGNLDVTVDGEPTTLPPGTVSVVLTSPRTI